MHIVEPMQLGHSPRHRHGDPHRRRHRQAAVRGQLVSQRRERNVLAENEAVRANLVDGKCLRKDR